MLLHTFVTKFGIELKKNLHFSCCHKIWHQLKDKQCFFPCLDFATPLAVVRQTGPSWVLETVQEGCRGTGADFVRQGVCLQTVRQSDREVEVAQEPDKEVAQVLLPPVMQHSLYVCFCCTESQLQ